MTHFPSYDSCDVTSRDVTFGHVTSGSHASSGHEQRYILYYYHSKKKKLRATLFPVRAASGDVTSSNTCVMTRSPLLPRNMP